MPNKNSVLLLGPRGAGKSTLVRESFAQNGSDLALWIDLLQPEQEEELQRNPGLLRERIVGTGAQTIVIDEVQKIPALLDVVHELIESRGARFILTGSSARKLKRGGANLLAGRAFALHLEAFSYVELKDKFVLQDALEFGLLPRIYFPNGKIASAPWSKEEKTAFLQTYARTYLREEIQMEQHVRKIQPFRNFLEIAAQMNGKVVEYSNLARDTGVDHKTVAEYFQILEETLIGFFLEPYHRSIRKRQGKKPKFYFFDPGVKRALDRTLTVPLLPQTSAYGEAFEHLVILEFRKQAQVINPDMRLSFFRTHDGGIEIDLVLEKPGERICLVEIKSSRRVDELDVQKLSRIGEEFEGPRLYVLCQEGSVREAHGVRVMPWKEGIEEILTTSGRKAKHTASEAPREKVYPWRQCPAGQHRVVTHTLHTRPSGSKPAGGVTTRNIHCADNPSGKDLLNPLEIDEIAGQHFSNLKNMPCPSELIFKEKGAKYDRLIGGWVEYWNEVLKPDISLDPNLVKALIATESSFVPTKLADKKNQNSARGLMQIINKTRKILGDEKGELKDHFVKATRDELNEPNVNICAGVRWLFHTKNLHSSKLGRSATWEETVWRYKGLYRKGLSKKRKDQIEKTFLGYYEDLKKCGKKS